MKSRIITAPQVILSSGLTAEQSKTLTVITDKLNMIHKPVSANDAGQKIGYLCGFKGFEKADLDSIKNFNKQCLVVSGVSKRNIDILLKKLKENDLSVPLKAVVTPSNQNWDLIRLVSELEKEHEMLTRGQKYNGSK